MKPEFRAPFYSRVRRPRPTVTWCALCCFLRWPWLHSTTAIVSLPINFATRERANGTEISCPYDIRTVQELGHKDVRTTMIYTHVANRDGLAVRSLLD